MYVTQHANTPTLSGAAGGCAGSCCFRSSWRLCWLQLFQEQLDAVLDPAVSRAAGCCAGSSCFRSSWTLCWLQLFQEQLDAVLTHHLRGLCRRCGKDRQVVWTLATQPHAHFRTQQGRNSAKEGSRHQQPLNLNWTYCDWYRYQQYPRLGQATFLWGSNLNTGERMRIRSDFSSSSN